MIKAASIMWLVPLIMPVFGGVWAGMIMDKAAATKYDSYSYTTTAAPSYTTAAYTTAGYSAPAYTTAAYAAPAYTTAGYSAPAYSAPSYQASATYTTPTSTGYKSATAY